LSRVWGLLNDLSPARIIVILPGRPPYAAVARWVPASRRREKLPFSIHAELSAQPPEDQESLLDWCELGSPHRTREELRREIRWRTKFKNQLDDEKTPAPSLKTAGLAEERGRDSLPLTTPRPPFDIPKLDPAVWTRAAEPQGAAVAKIPDGSPRPRAFNNDGEINRDFFEDMQVAAAMALKYDNPTDNEKRDIYRKLATMGLVAHLNTSRPEKHDDEFNPKIKLDTRGPSPLPPEPRDLDDREAIARAAVDNLSFTEGLSLFLHWLESLSPTELQAVDDAMQRSYKRGPGVRCGKAR